MLPPVAWTDKRPPIRLALRALRAVSFGSPRLDTVLKDLPMAAAAAKGDTKVLPWRLRLVRAAEKELLVPPGRTLPWEKCDTSRTMGERGS